MAKITWEDVIKRDDLIGGEIENQNDRAIYRGPLAKIKEDEDGFIHLSSPWYARRNLTTGGWEKWHMSHVHVPKDMARPRDIEEGRVHFSMIGLGHFALFPRGQNILDTNKITGLPPDSERLLALFPELPFEHIVANRVCEKRGMTHILQDISELLPTATVKDVIALLRSQETKEEFLWFYIEAITGQKEIHRMVY